MNYLDEIADRIRFIVPKSEMPKGDLTRLFRMYALLVLAKGEDVTSEDVHNAWVAWMLEIEPTHRSLTKYSELSGSISETDLPFVDAIHLVAIQLSQKSNFEMRNYHE